MKLSIKDNLETKPSLCPLDWIARYLGHDST